MKKKMILMILSASLLILPIEVSASEKWEGKDNLDYVWSSIDSLDALLTEKESTIQEMLVEIEVLETEAFVSKETEKKAQAFDVIAKTIKDESGIDINTSNYQSILNRLTKLYHNNWFVRTAARTIIEWLF